MELNGVIDKFHDALVIYYEELILATAFLLIGKEFITQAPSSASVTITTGLDVTLEPMFLNELIQHQSSVGMGITELFQAKAIAAWSDLLNDVFEYYVKMHMSGRKRVVEFKTRSTKLDFQSEVDVPTQIAQGLVKDFAFSPYQQRIGLINVVAKPKERLADNLTFIKKHVEIRNLYQHHGGKVLDRSLKELGANSMDALDNLGRGIVFKVGQKIELYIPEMNKLRGDLFVVSNSWKK